jgi:FkbM family methyltransferase
MNSHLEIVPALAGISPTDSFLVRPLDVRHLHEVFVSRDYEMGYQVKPGDVVVDMGAGIGDFAVSIASRKPKRVYCVEPSSSSFELLEYNTRNLPSTLVNKAITHPFGSYNACIAGASDGDVFGITTFKDFVKDYNIDYIDFLKVDIEGGEYNIFNEENIDFLTSKVRVTVVEFHIRIENNNYKKQFVYFRDHILSFFDKYRVARATHQRTNLTRDDLTFDIYAKNFENDYACVNIWLYNTL